MSDAFTVISERTDEKSAYDFHPLVVRKIENDIKNAQNALLSADAKDPALIAGLQLTVRTCRAILGYPAQVAKEEKARRDAK